MDSDSPSPLWVAPPQPQESVLRRSLFSPDRRVWSGPSSISPLISISCPSCLLPADLSKEEPQPVIVSEIYTSRFLNKPSRFGDFTWKQGNISGIGLRAKLGWTLGPAFNVLLWALPNHACAQSKEQQLNYKDGTLLPIGSSAVIREIGIINLLNVISSRLTTSFEA